MTAKKKPVGIDAAKADQRAIAKKIKKVDYDTVRKGAIVTTTGIITDDKEPGISATAGLAAPPPSSIPSEMMRPIEFEPFQGPTVGIAGMGPDAPLTTNEKGASQSALPYRFDLIDGPATFKMAEVLHQGAVKYTPNNWRGIPVEDHLNHMIAHAYAYLAGDKSDEHLSHVMCRAMFAQAVAITDAETDGTI